MNTNKRKTDDLYTYMKFRGDLDLKNHPLNEVDALIFSELSYIQFENIVPGVEEKGSISLKEAAQKYVLKEGKESIFYARYEKLLEKMAQCPRYAELQLSNYVSVVEQENRQQFSAIHIQINPFLTFIAFRGTDETLVGWREDFNMSYMMPVPAQISAVDYVNKTTKGLFQKYYIGGHSKGGNLAIYASVFCDSGVQNNIKEVYNFDGPGFHKKIADNDSYLKIKERIHSFVPEASVVGMLMEHEEEYQVVKSYEIALMQHEGLTWSVDGTKFEKVDSTDEFSTGISSILRNWLERADYKERKVMVDTLFDIWEIGGIRSVLDFKDLTVHSTTAMVKAAATLPKEQREIINHLIKMWIAESKKTVVNAIKEESTINFYI
ncbi:MAG: DUF2974 domain-containing protein [Lachnospiraceae bacterium]|nr:DUF2974 domain-containing protein [Lachnospiraceae bacterium]